MSLKKQKHSTYTTVKKLGENRMLQLSAFGLKVKLESSEARRATINESEAMPGFLPFCFHSIWLKSLSSQQIVHVLWSCPINPLLKTVRYTGKELPQGELRSLLKQKDNVRRQSLNKHHLSINRTAQTNRQVLPSASSLGSPPSEATTGKQIPLVILL